MMLLHHQRSGITESTQYPLGYSLQYPGGFLSSLLFLVDQPFDQVDRLPYAVIGAVDTQVVVFRPAPASVSVKVIVFLMLPVHPFQEPGRMAQVHVFRRHDPLDAL